MSSPTIKTARTVEISIYMAGDIDGARQVVREFCYRVGFCVTVEPVSFIYTGGEETGFRVGIINYPRFPSATDYLLDRAAELAELLRGRLCQHSYSIVGPEKTIWLSTREVTT